MTHDELADKVRELERQLAHAQRERDQWKASYQDMVAELSKALAQLQQQRGGQRLAADSQHPGPSA
jgi:regulator of replication initiation timing